MKKTIILCIAIILTLLGIGHIIPSDFAFRTEKIYFENEPFEWDDDFDRYDISHREINEQGYDSIQHYYISSSNAKLIYSEEDWSCAGEIAKYYNAWGRMIYKKVSYFYINVYVGEQK